MIGDPRAHEENVYNLNLNSMKDSDLHSGIGTPTKQPVVPEIIYYRMYTMMGRAPVEGAESLPLRRLKMVSIYDRKGEYVALEGIERRGPFSAIGVPVPDADPDSNINSSVKRKEKMVLLEGIKEYSLEYPYAQPAIIWLHTRWAYYAVDSLSHGYEESGKADLFKEAAVIGNVINAYINMRHDRRFGRVMYKAYRLSRMDMDEFFTIICKRRPFLLEQFEQQDLPKWKDSLLWQVLTNDALWAPGIVNKLRGRIKVTELHQKEHPDLDSSDGEAHEDDHGRAENRENGSRRPSFDKISETTYEEVHELRKLLEIIPESPENVAKVCRVKETVSEVTECKEIKTEVKESEVKQIRKRKKENSFTLTAAQTVHSKILLPTEMSLQYKCPFCPVTLKRTREDVSICELARVHFAHHLEACGEPDWFVNAFECQKWPTGPYIYTTLPIIITQQPLLVPGCKDLPICIDDDDDPNLIVIE